MEKIQRVSTHIASGRTSRKQIKRQKLYEVEAKLQAAAKRGELEGGLRYVLRISREDSALLLQEKQQVESFQRTEKFLNGVLVLVFSRHHNLYFIFKPNRQF